MSTPCGLGRREGELRKRRGDGERRRRKEGECILIIYKYYPLRFLGVFVVKNISYVDVIMTERQRFYVNVVVLPNKLLHILDLKFSINLMQEKHKNEIKKLTHK
jgi:hypothetical protein